MLTLNKLFIVMDIQEVCDYWVMDRKEIVDFILNMWGQEDFDTDEEMNAFFDEIQTGNMARLEEALQGLGYTTFEDADERKAWLIEVGLEDE